jgi:hypothetical protein
MLREACDGNASAIDYLLIIIETAHLWDDLIDKDSEITDERVNRVFSSIMIDLMRNEFFRRFHAELLPIMEIGILNWKASNVLEGGDTEEKIAAHYMRHTVADVILMTARICRGRDYAESMIPQLLRRRRTDSFSQFIQEITT